MTAPVRVFLVDRCRIFADAISLMLRGEDRLVLQGTCEDAGEACDRLEEPPADVVLIHENGAAPVRAVRDRLPAQRILVLGVDESTADIVALIAAGARGYSLKNAPWAEVLRAIEDVHASRFTFPHQVTEALIDHLWRLSVVVGNLPGDQAAKLSLRERQIVEMIGRGLANKEIARSLDITLCTVKNHVHNILDKLQVKHRHEAYRRVTANGHTKDGLRVPLAGRAEETTLRPSGRP